jgi:hypothetical protein
MEPKRANYISNICHLISRITQNKQFIQWNRSKVNYSYFISDEKLSIKTFSTSELLSFFRHSFPPTNQ